MCILVFPFIFTLETHNTDLMCQTDIQMKCCHKLKEINEGIFTSIFLLKFQHEEFNNKTASGKVRVFMSENLSKVGIKVVSHFSLLRQPPVKLSVHCTRLWRQY